MAGRNKFIIIDLEKSKENLVFWKEEVQEGEIKFTRTDCFGKSAIFNDERLLQIKADPTKNIIINLEKDNRFKFKYNEFVLANKFVHSCYDVIIKLDSEVKFTSKITNNPYTEKIGDILNEYRNKQSKQPEPEQPKSKSKV